jgi:branched-chain amino acid transport system permease protein
MAEAIQGRPAAATQQGTGARRRGMIQAVALLALAAAAVAVPFITEDYRTYQFTQFALFAVIVLGLNILTGYAGQISLAHGAFVLVGAYVAAMGMTGSVAGVEVHPVLAVLLAGVVAAGIGVLVGFPALRLAGPYLAVITLGVTVAAPIILKSKYLSDYTQGAQGILVTKPMPPAGFFATWLYPAEWQYFIVLLPSALLIYLAWNIRRSKVGRAFIALRDSEAGAQMAGVNVALYKLMAFGISAFYAGIGGGLLVQLLGFVSPDTFTLMDSINFLTAMVVGGLGSIVGSILGGAFLAFQSDINSQLAHRIPDGQNLRWALYGVLLIVLVMFAPGGLAGLLRRPPLLAWLRGRMQSATGPATGAPPARTSDAAPPTEGGRRDGD